MLLLEQVKVIIFKRFQKNANTLLKKKRCLRYITNKIKISSNDSDTEDSDEEIYNEEKPDEENSNKEN